MASNFLGLNDALPLGCKFNLAFVVPMGWGSIREMERGRNAQSTLSLGSPNIKLHIITLPRVPRVPHLALQLFPNAEVVRGKFGKDKGVGEPSRVLRFLPVKNPWI